MFIYVWSVANKCFWFTEDDFIDLIIDNFEEKKRYADFLEKEGSVLAESSR